MTEHSTSEHEPVKADRGHQVKFNELMNDSWQLFQKKFWNLLGIYLIMTVITALVVIGGLIIAGLAVLITLAVKVPAFSVIIVGAGLLFTAGLGLWAIAWTVTAVMKYLDADDNPSVLETVQKAKPLAWILLPTIVINTLAVLGGFILFVIPGIILSISLGFVAIVAILENKRMWEALEASRNLVRGRWWNVFWLYVVMILLVFAVMAVTGGSYSPVMVFLSPFTYVFCYVLYKKLKAHPSPKEAGSDLSWFYKLTIALSSLAIIGAIAAMAAAAGPDWNNFKDKFDHKFERERSKRMDFYRHDEYKAGIPGTLDQRDMEMLDINLN